MEIGDKVRVKTNLKAKEEYGEVFFVKQMEQYRGQIGIIEEIKKGDNYRLLSLSTDESMYNWSEEMLESIEEENIMFKITDNSKEGITQLPTLPFVTKDERGCYRMYFLDKDKIRYLHLSIGAANTADTYYNIKQAVEKLDTFKEKIVKTELIIS